VQGSDPGVGLIGPRRGESSQCSGWGQEGLVATRPGEKLRPDPDLRVRLCCSVVQRPHGSCWAIGPSGWVRSWSTGTSQGFLELLVWIACDRTLVARSDRTRRWCVRSWLRWRTVRGPDLALSPIIMIGLSLVTFWALKSSLEMTRLWGAWVRSVSRG
jgi:hypothetical protein